jgi:metal-responsive CopG/Arc/MetJ family transcriptional regulator
MPSEKGDKQAVTIWVDKSVVERIERLAQKGDISRSQLIVNILEETVEYVEKLDKLGIWATARVFRDLGEQLKKRFDKGKIVGTIKSKI